MTLPASQQGFTLLEALAALVIISIGLLGILGLQTVAIVNTRISASQTLASIAADDIADRMRANALPSALSEYAGINTQETSKPANDCSGNTCSPTDMAKYDAWEWKQTLSTELPGGYGTVQCLSGTPCEAYVVTVFWNGQDDTADGGSSDVGTCPGAESGGVLTTSPYCYTIKVWP